MRIIIIIHITIVVFLASLKGFASSHRSYKNPKDTISSINNKKHNNQTVYICDGNYAVAYHSKSDCRGLNNCKSEIYYTDEYNAINRLDRRPCCICWKSDDGCITDYIGGFYRQVNPPLPTFPSFVPGYLGNAQAEVGMYLQMKYDARRDWIQIRIYGLQQLIEALLNSRQINCTDCDFTPLKTDFRNRISSYAKSIGYSDFAKDNVFNTIVNKFFSIERNIIDTYNLNYHKFQ